ncbi:hypothetical protein ACLOJK_019207 [Asimina triloba]
MGAAYSDPPSDDSSGRTSRKPIMPKSPPKQCQSVGHGNPPKSATAPSRTCPIDPSMVICRSINHQASSHRPTPSGSDHGEQISIISINRTAAAMRPCAPFTNPAGSNRSQ